MVPNNMEGVLNEVTQTVHAHNPGESALHTSCGVAYNLSPDQLETMSVRQAMSVHNASKCGRCFEDGRGY